MSQWGFIAPKFWDLSESIIQDRPNNSWFNETNTSAPSFPKKRKLRTKFDNRPSSSSFLKASNNVDETVHDRLARESTISFSRKLNPAQKRFFVEHEQHPPEPLKDKETDRIARLEIAHKPTVPRKRLKFRSTRPAEPWKTQQAAELLKPSQSATSSQTTITAAAAVGPSKLQQLQQKTAQNSKPQQTQYEEIQTVTPISREKRQMITNFFDNLLAENRNRKLATVHNYFENLKQKNKLLYKNKMMKPRKEIKQEIIDVSICKSNKRVISPPVLSQNKRLRLD